MQQIRAFLAAAWTSYRQQSRRTQAIIASIAGVVLIACCAIGNAANGAGNTIADSTSTSQSNATTARPTPTATLAPLAEHLTFTGDIAGVLTTGLNPLPPIHQEPTGSPSETQCSEFPIIEGGTLNTFQGGIYGKVGDKQYAVTIGIDEDDPAYTNPGTPLMPGDTNAGGSIFVTEFSGQRRTWQQVYGPSLQEPTIILNKDRQSGIVDAWMATTDQSQKDATATLHMYGTWRCG